MAEFSIQGSLAITGTVLATGIRSAGGVLTKVINLRFNNPAAYTVELYKYEAETAITTLIYNLSLSAGDTLTDNFSYALNPGDTITAFSNIVGTTYYAYGINY
jgi:hypothetical protein